MIHVKRSDVAGAKVERPAPTPLRHHNLAELARTGYWLCLDCQHICEPKDPVPDWMSPVCNLCRSPRIKHHPPVL